MVTIQRELNAIPGRNLSLPGKHRDTVTRAIRGACVSSVIGAGSLAGWFGHQRMGVARWPGPKSEEPGSSCSYRVCESRPRVLVFSLPHLREEEADVKVFHVPCTLLAIIGRLACLGRQWENHRAQTDLDVGKFTQISTHRSTWNCPRRAKSFPLANPWYPNNTKRRNGAYNAFL